MTLIYIVLLLWVLWNFYLAVMSLFRARENGTLSLPAKVLGYPTLFIGVLLDAFVNVVIMSVVFLELPQEWLVTKRLARLIKVECTCADCSWRKELATWICQHLLNPFDPDQRGHCR
jgi:hypothetical protein